MISGVVSHPAAASVKQSSGFIEESSDEKTSDDSSGKARVSEIQASFVAPVLDPGSESSPTISSDGTEISLSPQVEITLSRTISIMARAPMRMFLYSWSSAARLNPVN